MKILFKLYANISVFIYYYEKVSWEVFSHIITYIKKIATQVDQTTSFSSVSGKDELVLFRHYKIECLVDFERRAALPLKIKINSHWYKSEIMNKSNK